MMTCPDLSLPEQHVVVGLGANLGDCVATFRSALAELDSDPRARVLAQSQLYDTAPVGPPQPNFVNAAVRLCWDDSPESLLEALLVIERRHGRDRDREQRWGPRTLDLDLLLFGREAFATERLTLPHPRLLERAFALTPLADVSPELDLGGLLRGLGPLLVGTPWD